MERNELPMWWRYVPLKSKVEILYGRGLPKRQREENGIFSVYGSNGIVGQHTSSITAGPTIIIGRKGSVGAVHYSVEPCWPIDTTFYIDQFPDDIDASYLSLFLRSEDLASLNIHAAIPGIRREDLYELPLPIPYPDDPTRSLAEQRRIVARIETLFAELRGCRALNEKMERETGRLMESFVREVFDQSNHQWRTDEIDDIAYVQSGTAKGRRFRNRPTVELPYLRVANVQAGYLDLSEIKTIEIAEDEVDRYRLQTGDLLLTEGGDFDKLGRGSVWKGQIDPCLHQNHVFAVRFDSDKVIPEFAEYEMQSWHAKSYFMSVAKRTTNLASINKTQLRAFPFRYPSSITEQKRVVAHLDLMKQQVTEMQKSEALDTRLLEKIEQSLLAQAFRGEL